MRIAIIGGGFAGMTAAYELGKKGHKTFLFERMSELGGLAGTFPIEGTRLERGYHHWFTSDTHVIDLMGELGLGDRVMWIPSKVGFLYSGKIWNWVTPMDILRFSPMSLIGRLRLGLSTFYLTYVQTNRNKFYDYEKITAAKWLKKWAGAEAWDKAWKPLFYGKFGAEAENIPLLFLWYKARLRLTSRKGLNKEVLGYPRGSFQVLIDTLDCAIQKLGGKVYLGTTVKRVVAENGVACGLEFGDDEKSQAAQRELGDGYAKFDRIICTAPSFATLKIVSEFPDAYAQKMRAAKYMAAVLIILKMKHPLSHIYWMNIADRSIPFVATIEQTNFILPETYNNKHIMYVSNYLDSSSPYFQMSRDELFAAYLPHLKKFNPNFSPDWVEEYWHFKEAAAQPVMPLNYSKMIPDYRTPIRNLYLANTTQIYPEDRGTNYSVRLGQIIARMVDEDVKNGNGWK